MHDTFPFASRRVRVADVPPHKTYVAKGSILSQTDLAGIKKYNAFAGNHEHLMEKSLIAQGLRGRESICRRTNGRWMSYALARKWTRPVWAARAFLVVECGQCSWGAWMTVSAAPSPSAS